VSFAIPGNRLIDANSPVPIKRPPIPNVNVAMPIPCGAFAVSREVVEELAVEKVDDIGFQFFRSPL